MTDIRIDVGYDIRADRSAWLTRRAAHNRRILGDASAELASASAVGATAWSSELATIVAATRLESLRVGAGSDQHGRLLLDALEQSGFGRRRVAASMLTQRASLPYAVVTPDASYVLEPSEHGFVRSDIAGSSAAFFIDAPPLAGPGVEVYELYPPIGDAVNMSRLVRTALTGSTGDIRRLMVVGFGAAVLGMAVPFATGKFLPQVLADGATSQIAWMIGLLTLAVACSAVFQYVRNGLALRVQSRIQAHLEPAVWHRLLGLDVRFFSDRTTGEIVQRANAISQAQSLLSGVVVSALLGAFFSFGGLIVIAFVDWRLAVLAMIASLGIIGAMCFLAQVQQRFEAEVFEGYGEVFAHLYRVLIGIDKIQTAGREVQTFAKWAKVFALQKRADGQALHAQALLTALLAACNGLMLAFVVGGASALGIELDVSRLMVVALCLGQVVLALVLSSSVASSVFAVKPTLDRLAPVLAATPERRAGDQPPPPLRGHIRLEGVDFTYPGAARPSVSDVTLEASPGEMIAIVGPSGSGKSSIVRLLLGFEQADAGKVLFDGRDIGFLDRQLLRRQLGVVSQRSQLVRASLLENIVAGRHGLTEADAWHAASLAGIDEAIRALPLGMSTSIGEDHAGFSGGQVQRLLIARALITAPPVLILDEATSALDNATQSQIVERIRTLRCTRIVIAHRLSTIVDADRIYVMDHGSLQAVGTYDELLETSTTFRTFVELQHG